MGTRLTTLTSETLSMTGTCLKKPFSWIFYEYHDDILSWFSIIFPDEYKDRNTLNSFHDLSDLNQRLLLYRGDRSSKWRIDRLLRNCKFIYILFSLYLFFINLFNPESNRGPLYQALSFYCVIINYTDLTLLLTYKSHSTKL